MGVDNIKIIPVEYGAEVLPATVQGGETIGGQAAVGVFDLTTNQLLAEILIELRKLNLRQQEAFEETILDEDVS